MESWAGAEDTVNMIRTLGMSFIPNKVILLRPAAGDAPDLAQIAPFTRRQRALGGKATAYVCNNRACGEPTADIGEMRKQLGMEREI